MRNICSSLQSHEKDIVHAQEGEIVLVPDDDNVILKEREQINSYLAEIFHQQESYVLGSDKQQLDSHLPPSNKIYF